MARKIKDFDDYKTIKTTRYEYTKRGSKWVLTGKDKFLSSPKMHKYATDEKTLKFFRGMGGYEKNDYSYTKRGYVPVRNTSISPDRTTKIVRTYNFKDSDKLYDRAYKNYCKRFDKKK